MHRAITPFMGSAWPFSQLCAPASSFGFKQPLRDPWVFNVVVLLRRIDFSLISSELDLPWNLDGSLRGNNKKINSSNWDSPIFSVHADLQLMEFLGPNFLGWDGSSPLPCLDDKNLKRIVNQNLIVSYNVGCSASYSSNLGADHTHHISNRLAKWGTTDSAGLLAHFSRCVKIPAFLITHFIKLVCGASNSDGGRRRKFDPGASVHPDKSVGNPWPCYLCDMGDVASPGDCSRHIFTSCSRVKAAWEGVMYHPLGPHDTDWINWMDHKVSPIFIPDYQPAAPDAGYSRIALVMSFCWGIHKIIDQVKAGRSSDKADARAITITMSLRNIWAPIKKSNKSPSIG